ncbi:MAG: T9SS type A sorting domain-containing protein [Leeuwenhoekiella sp.]
MKNFYPKFFCLLLPVAASAQLYVQPNPTSDPDDEVYVYVKNEILFVEQDVSLQYDANSLKEGNLYLRDEGQLIQGNSNSANSGDGVLSAYQEGTVNQWDYHFWASPVGDPNNAGTGNVVFNTDGKSSGGGLFEPVDELSSNVARYTTGYNGSSNPLTIAQYWLFKFVAKGSYAGWEPILSNGNLNPGEGFTMKGVNNVPTIQRYDFRGRPNNGNISVEVLPEQSTLVGNPYPSAMDLSFYLLSNSGKDVSTCKTGSTPIGNTITGIAYFWESDPTVKSHFLQDYQGAYGAFSPATDCTATGIYTPGSYSKYDEYGEPVGGSGTGDGTINRHITPIGQGFFVVGFDEDDTTVGPNEGFVTAKNEFRVYVKESSGNSQFKSAERVGTSKISNAAAVSTKAQNLSLSPTTIAYNNAGEMVMPKFTLQISINDKFYRNLTTALFDEATNGFDAAGDAANISELDTDVNFTLPDSKEPFLFTILPYNVDTALPLKINGASAKNTYSIKISDINFESEGIWLHDIQTGEYFDILAAAHEFTLPKGVFTDRYEITFKDANTATLGVANEIKSSFDVFQNNKEAQLQILNPLGSQLKEITVFDMAGKQITAKLNEGSATKISISSANWSDGIYVVRVVTADNIEVTKKVSVYNKN